MRDGKSRILCGFCPKSECRTKLYFRDYEASVECSGCGQRHSQSTLQDISTAADEVSDLYEIIGLLQAQLQKKDEDRKKAVEQLNVKVNGLSNYLSTILSPLLTCYGMDKATGKAKPLTEMGKAPDFDCGQLCDRAFLIDPDHFNVTSYGLDKSGSLDYLRDTLELIKMNNEGEVRLVPIHADGEGHCLVHAVSRALVGWQLFWHPLRVNLKQHFEKNLYKYQMQFGDFIGSSEWSLIIEECNPDYVPSGQEPTGLRNIHIFGLANVLKRPIILLDCLEGIQSSGDYSCVFLPYFCPPSSCQSKDGMLNKPLCIAWSNHGRNHFIPLVGVKGQKCPSLSRDMIQRAWGVPNSEIDKYIQFDERGTCQIGGEKVLQMGYLQRLVGAMEDIFFQQNHISASLVGDVYNHIIKANGLVVGLNQSELVEKSLALVQNNKLYICLGCHTLALAQDVNPELCGPGGELYDLAVSIHKKLKDGQKYFFPQHHVTATYQASVNRLIPEPSPCIYCHDGVHFRAVQSDYSIAYKDGDRTFTPSTVSQDGYKHFWQGKEYDTEPRSVMVAMDWGGRVVKEIVYWFQGETDETLNSNVYDLAQGLVQKHFPGEFGSERLVQKVVNMILLQVTPAPTEQGEASVNAEASGWSPTRASKAILTGSQKQSIHKEDLTKSETERQLKQRIESHAPKQQSKLTNAMAAAAASGSATSHVTGSPKHKLPDKAHTTPPPAKSTSPVTTATTSSDPAATNKRIRLSTSQGTNLTLDLPSDCKFLELQSLISTAVGVPPQQQRIRYGFPPRELKPPNSEAEDFKVPIQPGDRVSLEVLPPAGGAKHGPEQGQGSSRDMRRPLHSAAAVEKKIHGLQKRRDEPLMNTFAEGGIDEMSDRVLQGLMDPLLSSSGGDSLDHCLSNLALTAALEHKDLWTHVQRMPHLFSVNGLFYKQVERDMGLENGKHCTLPLLPQKVFVYNASDDRLELCLEPYGHFPVASHVESQAQTMLPTSKCGTTTHYKPFSGQGHSLKSTAQCEDRMPTDIPMSPKRLEARRLNMFCEPTTHQESIEEVEEEDAESAETETLQAGEKTPPHCLTAVERLRNLPLAPTHLSEPKLVRRGPGYSELSPIPECSSNDRDMLHQLVSSIEQAVVTMGEEADALGQQIGEARGLNSNPLSQATTGSSPGLSSYQSSWSHGHVNSAHWPPHHSSRVRKDRTMLSLGEPGPSQPHSHHSGGPHLPNLEPGNQMSSSSQSDPGSEQPSRLLGSNIMSSNMASQMSKSDMDEIEEEPKQQTVAELAGQVAEGLDAMGSNNNPLTPVRGVKGERSSEMKDTDMEVREEGQDESKVMMVGENVEVKDCDMEVKEGGEFGSQSRNLDVEMKDETDENVEMAEGGEVSTSSEKLDDLFIKETSP